MSSQGTADAVFTVAVVVIVAIAMAGLLHSCSGSRDCAERGGEYVVDHWNQGHCLQGVKP